MNMNISNIKYDDVYLSDANLSAQCVKVHELLQHQGKANLRPKFRRYNTSRFVIH